MILGSSNLKPWSELDVLIMQAYQIYEDERCQQCGHPIWLCHSDDPRLIPSIVEDTCASKQALDDHRKGLKDGEDQGAVRVEYNLNPAHELEGMSLVDFREIYREQKRLEAEEETEDDAEN